MLDYCKKCEGHWCDQGELSEVLKRRDVKFSADDHKDIWIDARQYRDEWGILRQKDPAAWPLDAPIGEVIGGFETLANYKGPDPRAKGRTRDLE